MKRVGNLWPRVVSFENLLEAAKRASAGKRMRPVVAEFQLNLEPELLGIQRELESGSYEPGPYRTFMIVDPKPRMISAAPFRDRVVHHALTQVLEPIWERRFSNDSYACRKGYGVHRAVAEARRAMVRFPFVMKCDIRKYFASIDHQILLEKLERVIKCRPTLALARRIIDRSNEQEERVVYFPGDDLISPLERRRGLPLGNQTSQFFANVYLDELDQFVNRILKPGAYMRYVDDLLVFDEDARSLADAREGIREVLDGLRLNLHGRKCQTRRAADGVTFLGWRLTPGRARLVRGNVIRFFRRMHHLRNRHRKGQVSWKVVRARVQAWIAHAAHGETWALREAVLAGFAFGPQLRKRCRIATYPWVYRSAGAPIIMMTGTCGGRIATTTIRTTRTTTLVSE